MRLEQVRDELIKEAEWYESRLGDYKTPDFRAMADAIDFHLSQPQPVAQGEAVAWRVRIGDSDMWGYADSKSDAEFIGKQSGLPHVVQELTTIPAGYRVVPVEPTEAMFLAYQEEMCHWSAMTYVDDDGVYALWKAMLNAAPTGGG